MNRNDLFDAIGFVDDRIIGNSEVKRKMKNKRRFSKRTLMLVAVLCLLTVFTTAAIATKLFGLGDVLIGKTYPTGNESSISLSGYTGSKEYTAAAEWKAFEDSYDPDFAILEQANEEGFDDIVSEERYLAYNVYTKEMAEKLDEIAEKYGLSLHTGFSDLTLEELNQIVVNDPTEFSDAPYNTIVSGYMYDDGTFRYDGIFDLSFGRWSVDYQFSRSAKGAFDPVLLNIGDVSAYQEQTITTDSGIQLAAALSEDKALLIADFDSCYVTVNILNGTDDGVTFDDLKDLANTFNFAVIESGKLECIPQVYDPSFIEVIRECVFDRIPVETVRGTALGYTIAMAPEYFTYSSEGCVDYFVYDSWNGERPVYYKVSSFEGSTPEEVAQRLIEEYENKYEGYSTRNSSLYLHDCVNVCFDTEKAAPDYQLEFFVIESPNGCAVIETQYTMEMYEGLCKIIYGCIDRFALVEE